MHTQFEWQDEGIPESKKGYSHWDWDELFDKLAQRPNTWAMVYSEKPENTARGRAIRVKVSLIKSAAASRGFTNVDAASRSVDGVIKVFAIWRT